MADVIRYVDPDATGIGDGTSWTDAYTSLHTAQNTEAADDADTHIFYCRSSSGTADTTQVNWGGSWNDSEIVVEAASGHEAKKSGWDATRYRLSVADDHVINAQYNDAYNITLRNLQIEFTGTANWKRIISFDGIGAGAVLNIEGCRIRSNHTTGGNYIFGVYAGNSNAEINVENTIIYGSGLNEALDLPGTATVYQCVIDGDGGTGIWIGVDATVTITNCAVFNCGDDMDTTDGGTATISYCASDDGDGTNSVAASGTDWDNEFSDYANGDFTLLNSGNLYHGGTTISGGPSTDMDGDSWHASTPSIGVDEVTASATVSKSTSPAMFNSPVFGGILIS